MLWWRTTLSLHDHRAHIILLNLQIFYLLNVFFIQFLFSVLSAAYRNRWKRSSHTNDGEGSCLSYGAESQGTNRPVQWLRRIERQSWCFESGKWIAKHSQGRASHNIKTHLLWERQEAATVRTTTAKKNASTSTNYYREFTSIQAFRTMLSWLSLTPHFVYSTKLWPISLSSSEEQWTIWCPCSISFPWQPERSAYPCLLSCHSHFSFTLKTLISDGQVVPHDCLIKEKLKAVIKSHSQIVAHVRQARELRW